MDPTDDVFRVVPGLGEKGGVIKQVSAKNGNFDFLFAVGGASSSLVPDYKPPPNAKLEAACSMNLALDAPVTATLAMVAALEVMGGGEIKDVSNK